MTCNYILDDIGTFPEIKRIMFIQFGNFKEASARFNAGKEETYYAQEYSVRWVEALCQHTEAVHVLCLNTPDYEECTLSSGVIVSGMEYWINPKKNLPLLYKRLEKFHPSHLIISTPLIPALEWGLKNDIRMLPIFADSFHCVHNGLLGYIKQKISNWRLASILNNNHIDFVANHNIPACNSLKCIGVNPQKIVPWDWPGFTNLDQYIPKKGLLKKSCSIFFVGSVIASKGVSDAIKALQLLQTKQITATLSIAGGGDVNEMKNIALSKRVEDCVFFLGKIANFQVIPLMREHDIVIVPSWHSYPEGLPLTIYEAFISRTPLVISDHPMFTLLLENGRDTIFHKAGDIKDLADKIESLILDTQLYENLSVNSVSSYQRILCKTKWADLITNWIKNSTESLRWIRDRSFDKCK
jgi:glycosyltransferase involved in cell wall biosynthesis